VNRASVLWPPRSLPLHPSSSGPARSVTTTQEKEGEGGGGGKRGRHQSGTDSVLEHSHSALVLCRPMVDEVGEIKGEKVTRAARKEFIQRLRSVAQSP